MKQEKSLLRPQVSTAVSYPEGNKFSWDQKFIYKCDAQTTMKVGTNETGEDYINIKITRKYVARV